MDPGHETAAQGEHVAMDAFLEVAQLDLATHEGRLLLDGDAPFEASGKRIVRIVIPGDVETGSLTRGLTRDSDVALLVPTIDIDKDDLFTVTLAFYTGDRPLALLSAAAPLPGDVLRLVVGEVGTAFLNADPNDAYPNVGLDIKEVGVHALQRRIRRIEQSVRDALADEELTTADYAALRDYPVRLARVEELATSLGAAEPVCRSHEPRGSSWTPVLLDTFHKHVRETADDARSAVARLSGLLSSQQIVLTQRQASRTARFQRLVTLIGAAVLVPGLIAAVFGANVGVPGRDTNYAFWAMVLFMTGGGLGSYVFIRSLETNVWTHLMNRKLSAWVRRWPVMTKLAVLATVTFGALALGVAVLIAGSSAGP